MVKYELLPMVYCAVRYSISNGFVQRFKLKIYVSVVFQQTLIKSFNLEFISSFFVSRLAFSKRAKDVIRISIIERLNDVS